MSIHGVFENPRKSAYSIEYYDSKWEYDYMDELEGDEYEVTTPRLSLRPRP